MRELYIKSIEEGAQLSHRWIWFTAGREEDVRRGGRNHGARARKKVKRDALTERNPSGGPGFRGYAHSKPHGYVPREERIAKAVRRERVHHRGCRRGVASSLRAIERIVQATFPCRCVTQIHAVTSHTLMVGLNVIFNHSSPVQIGQKPERRADGWVSPHVGALQVHGADGCHFQRRTNLTHSRHLGQLHTHQ